MEFAFRLHCKESPIALLDEVLPVELILPQGISHPLAMRWDVGRVQGRLLLLLSKFKGTPDRLMLRVYATVWIVARSGLEQ